MTSKVHALGGGAVGIGTYLLRKSQKKEQPKLGELVLCGAIGAAVALLPDILEPANGPFHRSHMHSLAAGACVAYMGTRIWRMCDLPEGDRILYLVVCLAYLSHLALDLTTPAGLPPL